MNPKLTHIFQRLLILGAAWLLTPSAMAFQAGWRQISVAGATPAAASTTVALYYPTQAPARAIPMGPFTVNVAIHGAPEPTLKGLIVLSHGTGGSELGHSSLAEALARHGYLVAALRHPGDNWQDRSMLLDRPTEYFSERPRQVTRLIDALLRDPSWSERIARDDRGPKVGVLGHSAGGYTVLALVGGQADLSRIARRIARTIRSSAARARHRQRRRHRRLWLKLHRNRSLTHVFARWWRWPRWV